MFVTVEVLVGPLLLDRFRRQCLLQQAVVGIVAVVAVNCHSCLSHFALPIV